MALGVLLTRHLREQVRTPTGQRLCVHPITRGLYDIFLKETQTPKPDAKNSDGPSDEAIMGVRGRDALAFTEWANVITGGTITYRLPTADSLNYQMERKAKAASIAAQTTCTWTDGGEGQVDKAHFLWIPKGTPNPHAGNRNSLKASIKNDIIRTVPSKLLEILSASLVLMPKVIDNISSPTREIDPDLAIARAPTHEIILQNTGRLVTGTADALEQAITAQYEFNSNLSNDLSLALGIALARMIRRAQRNALKLRDNHSPQISGATIRKLESSLSQASTLATELNYQITRNHAAFEHMGSDPIHWIPDSLVDSVVTASKDADTTSALLPEALARRLASNAGIDDDKWEMLIDPDKLPTSLTRAVNGLAQKLSELERRPLAAWLQMVAKNLESEATSIFTRKAAVTSQVSTSIRLSALILAGESAEMALLRIWGAPGSASRQTLTQTASLFRDVAAGITWLDGRHNGTVLATETIMLAIE